MRRIRGLSLGGRLVLALAVGGAVFGIASAVQASIPDAKNVIHGCYNPNAAKGTNGTPLNIIDSASASCSKNMQAIPWNQIGPTGSTGPTGPSDAWDSGSPTGGSLGDINSMTTVAALSLPGGAYVVQANAAVAANNSVLTAVDCSLVSSDQNNLVPPSTLDSVGLALQAGGDTGDLSAQGIAESPAEDPLTVALKCFSNADAVYTTSHIDAIQVGTLHQQ